MTNLLTETEQELAANNKTTSDVEWVGGVSGKTRFAGSWDDFAALADFNYDAGYGGNEIEMSIKVVGKDWWLERGEYDGSEWWEFKTIPIKAAGAQKMRPEDIRER